MRSLVAQGLLAIRPWRKEQVYLQCWVWHKDPTTAACHSPAWLLTDFPVTWRSWLLDSMVEVKSLIKLWSKEGCPSSGSLPEQTSSHSKQGRIFQLISCSLALDVTSSLVWDFIFSMLCIWWPPEQATDPASFFGKLWCASKQWAHCWIWAGDLKSVAWEIRGWVPDLSDFEGPDFLNRLRSRLPSERLLMLATAQPPVSFKLGNQWV